jgi:hypothetical protein
LGLTRLRSNYGVASTAASTTIASGRFRWHSWRLDVDVDFLTLAAATAEKLATEEKESRSRDDHKDHQYGNDCRATATTIIISHKIEPPLCVHIRFSQAM